MILHTLKSSLKVEEDNNGPLMTYYSSDKWLQCSTYARIISIVLEDGFEENMKGIYFSFFIRFFNF